MTMAVSLLRGVPMLQIYLVCPKGMSKAIRYGATPLTVVRHITHRCELGAVSKIVVFLLDPIP